MIGGLTMSSHFELGRTKGNAVVVEFLGRTRRVGMLPLAMVEGDDGAGVFGEQVVVDAAAVVTGVIADGVDLEFELEFASGFEEAVKALEREGEVTLAGLSEGEVDGQVVAAT